jgi:hypothetical protein
MNKFYSEKKLKPTRDNWCSNFPNNQVEVTIYCNMASGTNGCWHRVCVWGNEDCGMEKDFFGEEQEKDALSVYAKVMNLDYVDFRHLKEMGFTNA